MGPLKEGETPAGEDILEGFLEEVPCGEPSEAWKTQVEHRGQAGPAHRRGCKVRGAGLWQG